MANALSEPVKRPRIEHDDVCPNCGEVIREKGSWPLRTKAGKQVRLGDRLVERHSECGGNFLWPESSEELSPEWQGLRELGKASLLKDSVTYDEWLAEQPAEKQASVPAELLEARKRVDTNPSPEALAVLRKKLAHCIQQQGERDILLDVVGDKSAEHHIITGVSDVGVDAVNADVVGGTALKAAQTHVFGIGSTDSCVDHGQAGIVAETTLELPEVHQKGQVNVERPAILPAARSNITKRGNESSFEGLGPFGPSAGFSSPPTATTYAQPPHVAEFVVPIKLAKWKGFSTSGAGLEPISSSQRMPGLSLDSSLAEGIGVTGISQKFSSSISGKEDSPGVVKSSSGSFAVGDPGTHVQGAGDASEPQVSSHVVPVGAPLCKVGFKGSVDGVLELREGSAHAPDPSPSVAQVNAGNYKKKHLKFKGFEIAIETAAGQVRRGVAKDGKAWQTTMKWDYGYFKGTVSDADKDHVDVFIGPDHDSDLVFVVDQDNADGTFDEHKVVLAAVDEEKARKVYLDNYEKGWQGLGDITALTLPQLRWWMAQGKTHKPIKGQLIKAAAHEALIGGGLGALAGALGGGLAAQQHNQEVAETGEGEEQNVALRALGFGAGGAAVGAAAGYGMSRLGKDEAPAQPPPAPVKEFFPGGRSQRELEIPNWQPRGGPVMPEKYLSHFYQHVDGGWNSVLSTARQAVLKAKQRGDWHVEDPNPSKLVPFAGGTKRFWGEPNILDLQPAPHAASWLKGDRHRIGGVYPSDKQDTFQYDAEHKGLAGLLVGPDADQELNGFSSPGAPPLNRHIPGGEARSLLIGHEARHSMQTDPNIEGDPSPSLQAAKIYPAGRPWENSQALGQLKAETAWMTGRLINTAGDFRQLMDETGVTNPDPQKFNEMQLKYSPEGARMLNYMRTLYIKDPAAYDKAIHEMGAVDLFRQVVMGESEGEKTAFESWVGFDLDGTLAMRQEPFNAKTVGEPVPKMIKVLKRHLDDGDTCKIFTARAASAGAEKTVKAWLKSQGLPELEVTNEKGPGMTLLYDDRAVSVKTDEGSTKQALIGNSGFRKPENHDQMFERGCDGSSKQDKLIRFFQGQNDWEDLVTWIWAEGGQGDYAWRVWFSVKYPEEIAKRFEDSGFGSDGKNLLKEWNAKGDALVGLWYDQARGKCGEDEYMSDTGFKDKLMEVLKEPGALNGMVGEHGADRRSWEKTAAVRQGILDDVPVTGPEAIQHALGKLDLGQLEQEQRQMLARKIKTKRGHAARVLGIIDGLRRNDVQPRDLMITKVPVLPAQFRPFSVVGETFTPGDANEMYKDLISYRDMYSKSVRELGHEGSTDAWNGMRQALRAVYGFDESPNPKSQTRNVRGFLEHLCGVSPKESWFQRKLLSKPQDSVARGVIVPDPNLGMDEIGVPEEMLWPMYGSHIQRRMVRAGMSPIDALKHVRDRSETAKRALLLEMPERPVVYSRSPAWHKFNTISGTPKMIDGHAIQLSPLVEAGLTADHNGDSQIGRVMLLVPATVEMNSLLSSLTPPVGGDTVKTMISKAAIPSFDTDTHTLHLEDLQDFPRGELQRHKPDGRNGVIDFFHVPKGLKVIAFDEGTGQPVWSEVSSYSVHPQREIEIADLSNGRQIVTDDDPRAIFGIDPNLPGVSFGRFTPSEAHKSKVLIPVIRDIAEICQTMECLSSIEVCGRDIPLTWDFGYLLGALAGDGWWDKKLYAANMFSIYLADLTGQNAARVHSILQGLFGKVSWNTCKQTKDMDALRYGDSVRHTFTFDGSTEFCGFLSQWLGGGPSDNSTGSASKTLPDFFMLAPREFRLGVLNGVVDTDGTVAVSCGKKAPQLQCAVSSTSLRLVSDVRYLCLTLGIRAHVAFSKTTKRGNTSWLCSLSTPDIKRLNVFSNLATDRKRRAFIDTQVADDNTSLVFDKIPIYGELLQAILKELKTPKLSSADRKSDTPEVRFKKDSQRVFVKWWRAKTEKLISRPSAFELREYLLAEDLRAEDLVTRARNDLLSASNVVDFARVNLWRKATLAFAPMGSPKHAEGLKLRNRLTQPLKAGTVSLALRQEISRWLEGECHKGCVFSDAFEIWWQRFVVCEAVAWTRVVSVQKPGIREDGYDLTVPGYETFMSADGIILSNTINLHTPASHDAVEEARTILKPSSMPFSIRNPDKLVPTLKHEQVLGLYDAANSPSKRTHKFADKEQALAAIRQGTVDLSDELEIGLAATPTI